MTGWQGFSDAEWSTIWMIMGGHLIDASEEAERVRHELVCAVNTAARHGEEAKRFWDLHMAREREAMASGEAVDPSGRLGRRGPKTREDFEALFGFVSQVCMDIGISPLVRTRRGWTNNPKMIAACVAVLASLRGKHLFDPIPSKEHANQLVRKWLSEWSEGPSGDRWVKAGMYVPDGEGN